MTAASVHPIRVAVRLLSLGAGIVLLLAGAAGRATAQGTIDYDKLMKNSPPAPSLYKNITFTPAQQKAVDAIRDTTHAYQAQINDEGGGSAVVGARTTALKERQRAKIRALLTAEQQAQFDQNLVAVRKFEAYLIDLQTKGRPDTIKAPSAQR